MKRIFNFILLLSAILQFANAQTLILEDTFDENEMSWTENSKPDLGECIIMDGKMKFDSNLKSNFYDQKHSYPRLLISEGAMPIDPANGFSISVDMDFKHSTIIGVDPINWSCGVLLDYEDDYNFLAIALSEKTCYLLKYNEGKLVRYKESAIKMRKKDNKQYSSSLKIEYNDFKLKIYTDEIEMTELRKVTIESPNIALFVTGNKKVEFDNVKIYQ